VYKKTNDNAWPIYFLNIYRYLTCESAIWNIAKKITLTSLSSQIATIIYTSPPGLKNNKSLIEKKIEIDPEVFSHNVQNDKN